MKKNKKVYTRKEEEEFYAEYERVFNLWKEQYARKEMVVMSDYYESVSLFSPTKEVIKKTNQLLREIKKLKVEEV